MFILLLRGYSQSGKDFVGNVLCEKYGYQRFAFADSLKEHVSRNYQVSIDVLHSQEGKRSLCEHDSLKRSYRQILIDEAKQLRKTDDDCFAKDCCQLILQSNHSKIVITDWRFMNEWKQICSFFPNATIKTIHVIRSSQTSSPVMDPSEYELHERKDDYIIVNRGDNTIYQEIELLLSTIQ